MLCDWSSPAEYRGIWQIPSTLWHRALPCAPGTQACLHCWHTGQECAARRGLAERLYENTQTSRLPLQNRLCFRKDIILALGRQCHARKEAGRVDFFKRPWKERESHNRDDRRHNHQGKLWAWRRNSLATDSPLPGKNWDAVSRRWHQNCSYTGRCVHRVFRLNFGLLKWAGHRQSGKPHK